MASPRHSNLSAFRHAEFRSYILSRALFIMVLNMQATLVSWKVYEITKDPFSIGLIGLVEFFPAFLAAFYSGYLIDRSDKRKVLVLSVAANLLLTSAFAYITGESALRLLSKGTVLAAIYGIAFCTGLARAFSGPASFALVSRLVPKEELPSAIAWHTTSWQVAAVGGPALAGLMYAKAGITPTFGFMVASMALALFFSLFLKPKPPTPVPEGETMLQSIREGFRFVWRTREVLGALSLDLFAVFFGGATALLPYFSDEILQRGPEGLGILRSAPSVGAVVLMVWVAFRPLRGMQGRQMLLSVVGFGVCTILFGLSTNFWLSVGLLFLSGILDGISVIVRSTILQLQTPEEMRGRVASLNSIFIMSSNELGAFESGFTARWMGVVPAVVFGGCMTLVVAAVTWVKAPTLRKMEY
jgi:MFS family permease